MPNNDNGCFRIPVAEERFQVYLLRSAISLGASRQHFLGPNDRFWPEADTCNFMRRSVDKGPEGSAGYAEARLPEGVPDPLSRAPRHCLGRDTFVELGRRAPHPCLAGSSRFAVSDGSDPCRGELLWGSLICAFDVPRRRHQCMYRIWPTAAGRVVSCYRSSRAHLPQVWAIVWSRRVDHSWTRWPQLWSSVQ